MRSTQIRSFVIVGGLIMMVGCGARVRRDGFFDSDQDPTTPASSGNKQDPAGGPFGSNSGGLVVEPKNTTIFIDTATSPATPASLAYKVTANGKDVSSSATFAVEDPSLGSFNGATFTSVDKLPGTAIGVSTIVQASTSEGTGPARLTIVQLRKTGDQRDFFFIVPYGANPDPQSDVLKFSTNIKQADVAFLMDTTGSMQTSINNLKSALQGTLMSQLQAAIPNVGLAVVDFRDFSDGAAVVKVRQVVTTNLSLAQAAVGQMSAGGGGDGPEASIAALMHTVTGAANSPIPLHTPPAGTTGGVDFRAGAAPVVVHIHDNDWHDPSGNATLAGVKSAFQGIGAKFVNISNNGGSEVKANELSDATSSNVPASAFGSVSGCSAGQCCTGVSGAGRAASGPGGMCRLNFLSSGGNGVSGGIVKAIEAIAVGSSYDVKAVPSNDPANAGGVDASKFIKALRAMDEGNAGNGCPAAAASDTDGDGIKDTFLNVTVGTPVCFEVIPATNTTVMPADQAQFFNAFVDVIGVQGNVKLDQRSVRFMVPPKDAGVN